MHLVLHLPLVLYVWLPRCHARLDVHLWQGRCVSERLLGGSPPGSRNRCRPQQGTCRSLPRNGDGYGGRLCPAGLTLGACTGAGTVRTYVPMPSRVVDGAGGGVDQGPTPGPAVLPTAVCPHCVATSSATIWVSFFPCWPSPGFAAAPSWVLAPL